MAYGDVDHIAALAQMWTLDGEWVDPLAAVEADPEADPPIEAADAVPGTNPTLTQVTTWLDDLSSTMDLALADAGFTVPVTVEAALAAINPFIEMLVADLCHAANSSGRLYTERTIERALSPMIIVAQNIKGWVKEHKQGLINIGVPYSGETVEYKSFSVPPARQL